MFSTTPAYATTSHQIKINVFDSTSLTTIMEACDEIKADQQQNHIYTQESYENLMEKCEAGQETLDCLAQASDASECNDPDEEIGDIEDAIEELEIVPTDPDPSPPINRDIPTAPNTGTFTINIFGKTITIPTVPFVLLAIATIATITGVCLLIKYKRSNRNSNTSRNRNEKYGKESILYQSISTLSIVAVFGILVFTLAHTGAEPIVNTNDEPTSIATISNVIVNVDKKNENADPIEKTATITTIITTENEAGYTLSAKLNTDQDTYDALVAGITAELNMENLTTTAVRIYSSDDDTSPDTKNHTLAVNIPASTLVGTYGLTIVYETEDNEIPFAPSPFACVAGPNGIDHGRVGYMQNLNSTNTAGWAIGDYGTATDIRNKQDYVVCKLQDGHVWMLNNLKLGSTTGTTPLTPANTNIASNWTLPQVRGAQTPVAFDIPYAYDTAPSATNNIADDTFYGYYYNWCAATAGGTASGGSNTCPAYDERPAGNVEPDDATGDICPANWRLPIGGSTGEFAWLNAKMKNPSASSPSTIGESGYYENWQFTGPFRGVFSADVRHAGPAWLGQGSWGFWWSSSHAPGSSANALNLYVNSSSVAPGGHYFETRYRGFTVRCILKY
ncbi:fibrobacter succinogenes major paralogous domain-containing protein [Candidatus Saccharibacteria bacterium]|nr:fibrobacter succinogenes major paralogous domain-containing protein [Candidatus Saccharibacteria bacterium]